MHLPFDVNRVDISKKIFEIGGRVGFDRNREDPIIILSNGI